MIEKQRQDLIAAVGSAYVTMHNAGEINSAAAYQANIEPLLWEISQEGRSELADAFRNMTLIGNEMYSMNGLAFYLDPQVGGS